MTTLGSMGHFWVKLMWGGGVMGGMVVEEGPSLQSTPPQTHTLAPDVPTIHAPACTRRCRIKRGQKQMGPEECPKKWGKGKEGEGRDTPESTVLPQEGWGGGCKGGALCTRPPQSPSAPAPPSTPSEEGAGLRAGGAVCLPPAPAPPKQVAAASAAAALSPAQPRAAPPLAR